MLNFLTTDRTALLARAENALAGYGRALLAADASGATPCTADPLDLATGLNVLSSAVAGVRDDRTAAIIAYLLDRHKLNEAALTPFAPLPLSQQVPSSSGGLQTMYFADILGPASGNGALVAALAGKVDVVSGKALSSNDYLSTEKAKLAGLPTGFAAGSGITLAGNNAGGLTITSTVSQPANAMLARAITVSGTNGQVLPNNTVLPVGLDFTSFMEQILVSEIPATYTQPSASLTGLLGGPVEVGTTVTSALVPAFSIGDAGALTSYALQRNGTGLASSTTAPITYPAYTENYVLPPGTTTYAATFSYAAGIIKQGNKGSNSPGNILAGSKAASQSIVAAYRIFFGPTSAQPTSSATARALPGNQLTTAGNSFILNTGTTAGIFCFWLPTGKTLVSVIDTSNLGQPITSSYVASALSVNDANNSPVAGTLYTLLSVPYPTAALHQINIS